MSELQKFERLESSVNEYRKDREQLSVVHVNYFVNVSVLERKRVNSKLQYYLSYYRK